MFLSNNILVCWHAQTVLFMMWSQTVSEYVSFKVALPGFVPDAVASAEKQTLQSSWVRLQLNAKLLPKGQWSLILIQVLHELGRNWTCDWLSGFPVIHHGILLHVISLIFVVNNTWPASICDCADKFWNLIFNVKIKPHSLKRWVHFTFTFVF